MKNFLAVLVVSVGVASLAEESFVDARGHVLVGKTVNGETHPDWKALVDTALAQTVKRVNVPSNVKWIAYEDDMAEINRLPGAGIGIPGTSTLILDDTTTWFSTGNITPNCDATILKRGPSRLKQTTQQYNFYGTLVVASGVVERAEHYLVDGERHAKIVVKPGGTLHLNYSASMGDVKITAEGDGYQGQGAIVLDKNTNGSLPYLVLADDTLVVQNANGATFLPFNYGGSGRYYTRNPTLLELHGHTLTISGSSASVGFSNTVVSDDPEGLGKIVVEGLASGSRQLLRTGTSTQIAAPIELAGDTTIVSGVWSNALSIAEGKTLTFAPSSSTTEIALLEPVTGAGNVAFAGASGGTVRLQTANAYAGTTTLSGTSAFNVLLSCGDSIPDFSKLTTTGGVLVPAPTYDETGALTWTAAQILALHQPFAATTIIVDGAGLTNLTDLVFLKSAVEAEFPDGGLTWSARGMNAGGYSLSGPYTAEKPLNLDLLEGSVRLTGEDPINLDAVTVGGSSATAYGTLVLDGARDVLFTNQTVTVGRASGGQAGWFGRMVVTNSLLRSTHQPKTGDDEKTGTLFVGRRTRGVLDIEAGSVVSNKIVVGGGTSFSSGDGVGAVNQFDGSVYLRTGGANHYSSGIGTAGHGSYYLEKGDFTAQGAFMVGGYSCGIFRQLGGTVTCRGNFMPSGSNGGKSEVSILGGSFELVDKGGNWTGLMGNGGASVTTIAGSDTFVSTRNSTYGIIYNLNSSSGDNNVIYNLNDGGVLETCGWYCYTADLKHPMPFIVNFNGGVLRPRTYETPFVCNGSKYKPRVIIGEKGAVFDTQATDVSNAGTPFETPLEGGVQAIALPAGGLSGYPAIPRVQIAGDGYGASAIALWDARAGVVTNILVTSHGWGYTAAATTVSLEYCGSYGRQYTFEKDAVTIGDNTAGGLTKSGAKKLTLYGTNTWAKWTRVLGGTLKAANARAIPNGTMLTLADGAILDLNNVSKATFTGVNGTGGSVVNGTLAVLGEWELSARQAAAGVTTRIYGALDLTDCAGIRLTDAAALESLGKVRSLKLFSATEVVGLENLEVSGLPSGWKAVVDADGVTLRRGSGFMIIIDGGSAHPVAPTVETVTYAASDVEVLVAADAPKTVLFAASELTNFLAQSFGASVPVVTWPTQGKKSIILGDNGYSAAAGLNVPSLPRDASIIKVTEDAVYIAGRDDPSVNPEKELTSGGVWSQYYERGTLFGVYEFLECYLGVRMYFPGELGTVVPHHDKLVLPLGTRRDVPCYDLDRRYSIFWDGEYFDKAEPSWNQTICRPKTLQSYRNRCTTTDIPCCHGSNGFKYTDRFGETHPEYFALVYGNQRSLPGCTYSHQLGQLCWTSGVLEEMYQDAKAYLTGAASTKRGLSSWGTNCRHNKYVDIMPQDGFIGCLCANCQAAYNKDEKHYATDLIWGNTAALANRLIEEKVPGYVTMMSYSPYGRVPDVELPTNVLVMVAGGGPWSCVNPASYETEKETIRGWTAKLGHKVWLWNYAINTAMKGVPQMTPKAWGEHYSSLAPWIAGAFAECESSHFIYNYLNYYIFGKVCWNPSCDWRALLEEHYRVMFGAAAAEMRVIYDLLERKWLNEINGNIDETEMGPVYTKPCFYELWNSVYSPVVLERLDTLFDLAAAKVVADSIEARRIAFFREQFLGNLRSAAEEYRTWCDPAREEAWRAEHPGLTDLIRRGGFEGLTQNGRVFGDTDWSWQWYITEPSLAESTGSYVALDTNVFYSGSTSAMLCRTLVESGTNVTISQLFNTDKFERMKTGTRYRLSFMLRLENVRRIASGGGFSIRIWDDKNVNFPRSSEGPALVGTTDWIAQSYEFTSGEHIGQPGYGSYPLLEFRLNGATGTVWLDDVQLAALPEEAEP